MYMYILEGAVFQPKHPHFSPGEFLSSSHLRSKGKSFFWEQTTHLCERISEQQNKQHMSWMCFQIFFYVLGMDLSVLFEFWSICL